MPKQEELWDIMHECDKLYAITELAKDKLSDLFYEESEPVHRAFEVMIDEVNKIHNLLLLYNYRIRKEKIKKSIQDKKIFFFDEELWNIMHECNKLNAITELAQDKLSDLLYEESEPVHKAFGIMIDEVNKIHHLLFLYDNPIKKRKNKKI